MLNRFGDEYIAILSLLVLASFFDQDLIAGATEKSVKTSYDRGN